MKQKTPTVIVSTILILVAALATFWYVSSNDRGSDDAASSRSGSNINYGAPSKEEIAAGTSAKKNSVNIDNASNAQTLSDPIPMTVTSKSVGDTGVKVRVKISGIQQGSCEMVLTGPQNMTVRKSAPVQTLASYSTCQGFDLAASELMPGSWHFAISGSFENDKTGQVDGDFTL